MTGKTILRMGASFLFFLLLAANCPATKAGKSEPGPRQSIPKLLREYGFKHQTATWTSVTVQTEESGKKTESAGKIFISSDKYRMETKDPQNGKTHVFLDDGADMFIYTPEEKKAIKWGPAMESMFGSMLNSDLVAESVRQRKTAKKTGNEVVDGKPCELYTYTSTITMMNNSITSEVKEWVWVKENFPLKSVVKTPKHQMKIVFMTTDVPASETVNQVKDLVLDQPVDEALFRLPVGTKIETMETPPAMGGEAEGQKAQPRSQGEKSGAVPSRPDVPVNKPEPQATATAPDVQKLIKGLF